MALPTFHELDGTTLEVWFKSFLQSSLAFEHYYPSGGQIELCELNPSLGKGNHLEIDGILRIHKTGILFEFTAQKGDFREKIRKFLRNAQIFTQEKHIPLRKKFELFGIPQAVLDDFEEIENWKYVFFGTHPDFDLKNYSDGDFADYATIAQELYLIKPTQLEYLRQLTNSIGKFGRNELLSLLNFVPSDLGDDDESFSLDFIKAEGKYISGDHSSKADVYLVKFKVQQLLNIARVSRYEGLPFMLQGNGQKENYQRLLIEGKLSNIAEKFINGNKKKTFPNTITLAISNECEETADSKLRIPKKYSSIDIIDGQHRLFGYTRPEVSDEIRENAEILATAIKFRADNEEDITKYSAKVFCEINSTQATVSKDLLYLIKYDVLGDRDYGALAGKMLLECDKGNGSLKGIFAVNTLRNKNNLNKPCINIVNIIEQEIVPFLKGEGVEGFKISSEKFAIKFENADPSTNPGDFLRKATSILEWYFSYVKQIFSKDWLVNAETILISESYFAGFIRFLRFHLYNNDKEMKEMAPLLEEVKAKIDTLIGAKDSPCFPVGNPSIPGISAEGEEIFKFLAYTPA